MEKICIICREKKYEKPPKSEQTEEDKQKQNEFNLEHIIPKAIGGNITFREVCKNCNENLKDGYLTDHPLILFLRDFYNLKGQSKSKANPLKRLEDQKIKTLQYTIKNGRLEPTRPKIVKEDSEGKHVKAFFDEDSHEEIKRALNIINSEIEQQNETTQSKLQKITEEELLNNSQPFGPRELGNITCETDFKLVLLKIIYEIGVKEIGEEYLEDEVGKHIASNLFEVVKGNPLPDEELLKNIQLVQPKEREIKPEKENQMEVFRKLSDPSRHIIGFYQFEGRQDLSCYVNLFGVMEGIINLTKTAQTYECLPDIFDKVIINEVEGEKTVWCRKYHELKHMLRYS